MGHSGEYRDDDCDIADDLVNEHPESQAMYSNGFNYSNFSQRKAVVSH